MHLYSVTLQPPSGINKALYGNFSGPKAQEILVSKGKYLEIMRPDEATYIQIIYKWYFLNLYWSYLFRGKLVTVLS